MISVFELERHGISFEEWIDHKNNLPAGVWNLLENEIECPSGPTMLGYTKEVGYFIVGSGQGPFVIWMENPQEVSGPYPFRPKAGEKRYDYEDVKLEKKFLTEQEARQVFD